MKLPSICSTRVARSLYNNGIQNLTTLASSTKLQVEDILLNTDDINGKFFISGKALDMSAHDIAKLLITDAQQFLKNELGLKDVKWDNNTQELVADENAPVSASMKRKRGKRSILLSEQPEVNESFKEVETPKSKKPNTVVSAEYKKKLRSSLTRQKEESIEERSNNNASLFLNSGIATSLMNVSEVDVVSRHMEIIEVLTDKCSYKNFVKEISKQTEISLSVAIQRMQVKALSIGGNLLKTKENEQFNFKIKETLCIAGISICSYNSKQVYYLDLQKGTKELIREVLLFIRKLFENFELTINIYDTREHIKVLESGSIVSLNDINSKTFDPRLGSWIMDPDNNPSWQEIMPKFAPDLGELVAHVIKFQSSSSLGMNIKNSVDPKIRSSVECFLTNKIKQGQLLAISKTPKLLKVLENLEMPIQKALAKMEQNGFPINKDKLYGLIEKASFLLRQLEHYIYKLNGRKFDLTNSKEVAKVVGIHGNKEKKKISTAKNVLAKIDLPIADCIITYRTLSKTITNVQPMTKLVKNDRVYASSFSLTQTGRISMYEPNLQNVTKDFFVELIGRIQIY